MGPTVGVYVPVVHRGEDVGGYDIRVSDSDPNFAELKALWKARYPTKRQPPVALADHAKIVSDFAAQFPEDSR